MSTSERPHGASLIATERLRQIATEGWTADNDDGHTRGQLAWAASCYAAPDTIYRLREGRDNTYEFSEPWPQEWYANVNRGEPGYLPWRRPECSRITELVKAGALIAAEIDRLQRLEAP